MTRAFHSTVPFLGLLLLATTADLAAASAEVVVRESALGLATERRPTVPTVASLIPTLDERDLAVPGESRIEAARRAARVMICHIPPGNPTNFRELMVSASAVDAHLANGSILGSCEGLCSDNSDCGFDPTLLPMPGTQFCYRGSTPINFLGGGPAPDCNERALGTCTDVFAFCAAIFTPVCDCDGNMYDNACTAQLAGANWIGEAVPVDIDGDGIIDFLSCD